MVRKQGHKAACEPASARQVFPLHFQINLIVLSGVYMHGDNITIYRTFNNITNGANLGIHTWLLSLEERYKV